MEHGDAFHVKNVSGRFDVAVVGGGPAGSCAALALARGGARVALFEKDPVPRYKPCGGGITGRAMGLLPSVVAGVLERSCTEVILNLGSPGLRFRVRREEPILYMVMRDRFDAVMLSAARDAGARVHSECRVTGIHPGSDGVRVETSRGEVFCRFVVAADGALGRTAVRAGWRRPCRFALAVEAELEASPEVLEGPAGTARFDFGGVPGGYAWVFPKQAHLSVGLGVFRGGGPSRLPERLGEYLRERGLDGCRTIRRRGAVIPVSPRPEGFFKGRVLLAGDAAGLADPLTGEGIHAALQSGLLAAEALVAGAFQPGAVREAYEAGLRERILGDLTVSRGLSRFFYDWPRVRNALFRLHGQGLSEAMGLVITGSRRYGDLLCSPRNYLRLLGVRAAKPGGIS